jgi:hypothetical protein
VATTTARTTTSTSTRAPTSSRAPPAAPKKQDRFGAAAAAATPPPYNVKGGVDFSRVEKEQKNDKSEWTPIAEEEFVLHREPVGEAAVVSTLQEVIDTDATSKLPSRSYSGLGHVRPMPTLFPAKKESSPEPSSTTAAPSSRATPGKPEDVNSPFFMSSLASLPPPPPPPPAKISATYKLQDIAGVEKPLMDAVLTNTHVRVKESDRRLDQEPTASGSMKMGGTLSESRGSLDAFYKPVALIPAQNSTSEDPEEDFVMIPTSLNNSASIPVYIVHNTEKTTAEPEPIFTIEMTEEEPMTFTTVMKEFSEGEEEQTEAFTEEIVTTVAPEEEAKPIASKVGPTLSSLLLKPLTASQRTAEVDSMSPIKAGLLYREPKSGPASSAIKDSLIQGFPKNEFNSAPAFLRRNNTIKKPTTVITTTVRRTPFDWLFLTNLCVVFVAFAARTDHSDGAGDFELLVRRSAAGAGSRSQVVRRCRRLLGFLG